MFVGTTWKQRPISPQQADRLMQVWAKLEETMASDHNAERLCWYIAADGSSGLTVSKVSDADAAAAIQLESSVALSEFLELTSKIVLDLDSAMPAITKGMERMHG